MALGATLGSNTFHTAKTKRILHFDLGIKALSSRIPITKASKKFNEENSAIFQEGISPEYGVHGLDIKQLLIPIIQANLGIGENTNLVLRYTQWNDKKLGMLTLYSAGVKYELEDLFSFSRIPIDIGILALYQKYEIEEFLEGAVFGMDLVTSKHLEFIPVELYASVGYIKNETSVRDPLKSSKLEISVPGMDGIKYHVGLNVQMSLLILNVEYNYGDFEAMSVGLNITF